jgi:hypothetical protein
MGQQITLILCLDPRRRQCRAGAKAANCPADLPALGNLCIPKGVRRIRNSENTSMSKSIVLAIVVAVVIIGGFGAYFARDGIEKDQEPGQSEPHSLQTAQ